MIPLAGGRGGRILVHRSTREIEARRLADLDALAASARASLRVARSGPLAPVRVLVSSGALRIHFAERIARASPANRVGVVVSTLWNAARDVLRNAGTAWPRWGEVFEILVAREVAREPALASALAGFEDAGSLVASSVRDLLNAGLDAATVSAALARSLEEIPAGPERDRARAVVAVATRTREAMTALGSGRIGDLLDLATRTIRERGPGALPSRAILVHGFADATGRATEFLRALLEVASARVYLDEPFDPALPGEPDRGVAFGRRFRDRLAEVSRVERGPQHEAAAPRVRYFSASGGLAEIREAAHRIRELTAAGTLPESIALVARNLDAYAIPIRRVFGEIGIPWSGPAAPAGLFPRRRRFDAALSLLARRAASPVDAWIDAASASSEDLRSALATLGVARMGDVETISLESALSGRDVLVLPTPAAYEDERQRARRREMPALLLEDGIRRIREANAFLAAWPASADLAGHVSLAERFFRTHLGWLEDLPGAGLAPAWVDALGRLAACAPGGWALTFDEFLRVARRQTESLYVEAMGGAGAGVQVLDVLHARGLTFQHLFLVGMNRGVFPRVVSEDPLLADSVRRRLKAEMDALPIKAAGFDEESFLFAELFGSAPEITISWQRSHEDGRELAPSVFVERLRLHGGTWDEERIPRLTSEVLQADLDRQPPRPLTAREALVFAALSGSRRQFADLLGRVLSAPLGGSSPQGVDPDALARAKIAVLEEVDPPLASESGRARAGRLSPYFGAVGPIGGLTGLTLPVTALERFARCPWQTFLTRILRLARAPDPLAALPSLDARLVGIAVHRALALVIEAQAAGRSGGELATALERGPAAIERPTLDQIDRAVRRAAAEVGREEGILLAGYVQALAEACRRYVRSAIETDWSVPGRPRLVYGVELEGRASVPIPGGTTVNLLFRADRADDCDSRVVLADFKTGRPFARVKTDEAKVSHLLEQVWAGTGLQAAAYLAGCGRPRAAARYEFVDPDVPARQRVWALESDDGASDVFREAVARLAGAWTSGVFLPRLEDHRGVEPRLCQYCEVAEACVRGDSGARRRLRELAERGGGELSTPSYERMAVERIDEIWGQRREIRR